MGLIAWENKQIKNLDAYDIALTKLTVLAFTLLLVKFWPGIASLEWYWYAIVFVLAAFRPMKHFFR